MDNVLFLLLPHGIFDVKKAFPIRSTPKSATLYSKMFRSWIQYGVGENSERDLFPLEDVLGHLSGYRCGLHKSLWFPLRMTSVSLFFIFSVGKKKNDQVGGRSGV